MAVIAAGIWILSSKPATKRADRASGPVLSTGARPSPLPEANEYFEKAVLFLGHQFDLPRARGFLEKALAIDPSFAEARAWYGFAFLLEIDGGFSNDSSYLYKAEEQLRRALQDGPDTIRVHSSLAALYFDQGQGELMRQEVEKTLALDPRDIEARNWLGNSLISAEDLGGAKTLFLQLLEQDPLFWPARMNLAAILRMEGDPAGTIRELEKILEQDPRNSYAMFKLARAFIEKNDLPQARRSLEGLPEAGRTNFDARLTWAILLALEGKTAEARAAMDEECLKYRRLGSLGNHVGGRILRRRRRAREGSGLAREGRPQRRRTDRVVPPGPLAGFAPGPSPVQADRGLDRRPARPAGEEIARSSCASRNDLTPLRLFVMLPAARSRRTRRR